MIINKKEVLRYLGVKGLPEQSLLDLIDVISKRAHEEIFPKRIMLNLPVKKISNGFLLDGSSTILKGNLINDTLKDCSSVYIFAATLTHDAEMLLKNYFSFSELYGTVCDAVLTTYIESFCDETEEEIAQKEVKEGRYVKQRISCGYGDFSIEYQKVFFDLLKITKLIGVKLLDSFMMYPNKSVTALIAVSNKPIEKNKKQCLDCDSSCKYRRDDEQKNN